MKCKDCGMGIEGGTIDPLAVLCNSCKGMREAEMFQRDQAQTQKARMLQDSAINPPGQVFGGLLGQAGNSKDKSEMEIFRDKLMRAHSGLVKISNSSQTLEGKITAQHALVKSLQTVLATYGWEFS